MQICSFILVVFWQNGNKSCGGFHLHVDTIYGWNAYLKGQPSTVKPINDVLWKLWALAWYVPIDNQINNLC